MTNMSLGFNNGDENEKRRFEPMALVRTMKLKQSEIFSSFFRFLIFLMV
jgi:hypothetical protein